MTRSLPERCLDVRAATDERPARILFAPIKVLDLNTGGAVVETDEWLEPDHRYPLRMEPGIRLTARVTRCAMAGIDWSAGAPRALYNVALRFDPPPAASRQPVFDLIKSLRCLAPADPMPTGISIVA